jgi:hypothetical protein
MSPKRKRGVYRDAIPPLEAQVAEFERRLSADRSGRKAIQVDLAQILGTDHPNFYGRLIIPLRDLQRISNLADTTIMNLRDRGFKDGYRAEPRTLSALSLAVTEIARYLPPELLKCILNKLELLREHMEIFGGDISLTEGKARMLVRVACVRYNFAMKWVRYPYTGMVKLLQPYFADLDWTKDSMKAVVFLQTMFLAERVPGFIDDLQKCITPLLDLALNKRAPQIDTTAILSKYPFLDERKCREVLEQAERLYLWLAGPLMARFDEGETGEGAMVLCDLMKMKMEMPALFQKVASETVAKYSGVFSGFWPKTSALEGNSIHFS